MLVPELRVTVVTRSLVGLEDGIGQKLELVGYESVVAKTMWQILSILDGDLEEEIFFANEFRHIIDLKLDWKGILICLSLTVAGLVSNIDGALLSTCSIN